MKFSLARCLLLAALALNADVPLSVARAVNPPAADLNDPAFARYVDLNLLGQAWDTLDPALLTDCALQLADGERILLRSHKAISAQQVLELATKLAAEKNDTATLDRLAKIASATKNTAIGEQIAAAKKLAGVSRKADATPMVTAIDTDPDQLALYQEAINGAKAAATASDASYFDNLEAALADKECILVRLSDTQRKHLTKLIGDTRPLLSKTADPKLGGTLLKLKEVSRESPFNPDDGNGFQGTPGGGFGTFGGGFGTFGQGRNIFGNPIQQYQPPQQYPSMSPDNYPPPQTPPLMYSPTYRQQPSYQQQPAYYPQQRSYYPPRPTYPPYGGSPRPSCYSPSTFGNHGWCGNR